MDRKPVPREAALVVNARSRKGEELFEEASAKLEEAGIRLTKVYPIKDPGQLIPTVAEAIASSAPMVIVGGGDGTLSCSIGQFVGRDCLFALLPLGTANSFARTLGIPLDLDGAIQTIAGGKRHRIDVGVINGHHFGNAASLGISPMISETVPHQLKKYLGRVGYVLWAMRCMIRFRPFHLTVRNGGQRHRTWATEVRIFNGRYQSGVEIIQDETVDTGAIVVQAVTGKSLMRLSWDWFAHVCKLPGASVAAEEFRGKHMTVETRPKLKISIDGEVLTSTPAVIECLHEAVEVVVPADA